MHLTDADFGLLCHIPSDLFTDCVLIVHVISKDCTCQLCVGKLGVVVTACENVRMADDVIVYVSAVCVCV